VNDPEIVVVADPAAAAAEAVTRTIRALREGVEARGRADWATTGGSSPIGLYRRLLEHGMLDEVRWSRVHVWWGDDRYVPRDHPASNVKPFDDVMLGMAAAEEGTAGGPIGIPIPLEQVHAWPTGEAIGAARGAAWCAAAMADELRANGPATVDGWPAFDLLILGAGSDGHTLSVFPGSPALTSTDLAMAIPAPTHIEPHIERVTLNPAVIGVARHVLVLATGAPKAMILGRIFGPVWDPAQWPAQLARTANATWILDEACAAGLAR
jgi:6-phosphogluconolactonase